MRYPYSFYHNLGYSDRALRIGIGAVAILAVLATQGPGTTLGWLALVPLLAVYPILTGLIAFDPVYAWTGIDTSRSSVIADTRLGKAIVKMAERIDNQNGQHQSHPPDNNTTQSNAA
ncbi:MAG: DUF2892 domain-containing protein [Gammaproteobacteria bacterium]|jgi:hypothetical protein